MKPILFKSFVAAKEAAAVLVKGLDWATCRVASTIRVYPKYRYIEIYNEGNLIAVYSFPVSFLENEKLGMGNTYIRF